MTDFPSADDYVRAVQDSRSFAIEELRDSSFPVHPLLGVPMPASGSSAVVFKAVIGGEEQALRFFTRHEVSTRDRYRALNDHFQATGIASHMATSTWIEDAITVNGQTWPAVRMQWVNGRTLDQYVDGLVEDGDTTALSGLVPAWRGMVRSLQVAGFAHGDLQHGNVLVDDSGQLRLVDFDCAWLDGFDSTSAPSESGHRNYQRTDSAWGRWMDTFPGLVVHTSLLALAKKPSLWDEMHNGENLIFESKNFVPPFEDRVWREIEELQDQQLAVAASRLRECCDPSWSAGAGLEALLGQQWWEQAKGVGERKVQTPPLVIPALAIPKQKTLRDKPGPSDIPRTATDGVSTKARPPVRADAGRSSKTLLTGGQQAPAWWGSSGSATGQTPANPSPPPTGRRGWSRLEKTGLALALTALVGVVIFIASVLSSAGSAGSSVRSHFSLSSYQTELGSCDDSPSSSGRNITVYDVEVVSCTGGSSPYYFQFHKYSLQSGSDWVDAAKSNYSMGSYSSSSCYDVYTASKSGLNYVFYVYSKSPYVAVVYAGSTNSASTIVAQNFRSIANAC